MVGTVDKGVRSERVDVKVRREAGRDIATRGGEEDMNIFGWQHVFVEKPEQMAGKLRTWIESGNLLPLSI